MISSSSTLGPRLVLLTAAFAAALSACGGGGGDSAADGGPIGSPSPAPAPAPGPAPAPAPAPPAPAPAPAPGVAVVLYFSDCQAGAASGCVPGNNANAGTSAAAPKQNLSGVNIDALPAGSQLLFARGGAWANFGVSLDNRNATTASPLVFDSYASSWGGSIRPLLSSSGGNAFNFGRHGDTTPDGGYTIRNLKLDGRGAAMWGMFMQGATRGVTVDNTEITGFSIGIHMQQAGSALNSTVAVRNSYIHRNREHGILGDATGLNIENNLFEANNVSGSTFHHAIYLGGHGASGVLRGNRFVRNSVSGGACTGGNVTVHGQWSGLTVENNTIEQDAATGGCYGFSITPGYTTAEYFRNVVVRGNTVINVGACAVCAGAAPGIVVENNKLINLQPTYQIGVLIPAGVGGGLSAGDDLDGSAVVRNNTVCQAAPASGSSAVSSLPVGSTASGNVLVTGSGATTGSCAR